MKIKNYTILAFPESRWEEIVVEHVEATSIIDAWQVFVDDRPGEEYELIGMFEGWHRMLTID